MNPSNGNETKSDIFPREIFRSDILFIGSKILKISMTFIIGTFQSLCKSEYNQVKRNKITRDMCKSDSIFPYLRGSTLFK